MSLELTFRIRAEGQKALDEITRSVKGISAEVRKGDQVLASFDKTLDETADGARKVGKAGREAQDGLGGMAVKATALCAALYGVIKAGKAWTVDAAQYAARTQTLVVVTDQLAKANGISREAIRQQVETIKTLGITTQEAHGTVQRMIFAQLDVAKATQLARVAQDAAVISGVNSSEALENIIMGITTGMTRLLHRMGLQVSMLQVMKEGHRKYGREMTETEKRAAMLDKVLEEGVKIYGSYEAAMGTAGKQMTSLKRYTDEARAAIGTYFVPALGQAIKLMTELAKWAHEDADGFAKMAAGATALAAGLAAARLTPGGPIPKALVGVAVGGATYAFGTQDPVKYYQEVAAGLLNEIRAKQEKVTRELEAQTITGAVAREQFRLLESQAADVRRQFIDVIAPIAGQRAKGNKYGFTGALGKYGEGGIDLGYGLYPVRPYEVEAAYQRSRSRAGSATGPLLNQRLLEEEDARLAAERAAEQIKEMQKRVDTLVHGLRTRTVDPMTKLMEDYRAAMADLQKGGASPEQVRAVQTEFAGARKRLFDELMGKWREGAVPDIAKDAQKFADDLSERALEWWAKQLTDALKRSMSEGEAGIDAMRDQLASLDEFVLGKARIAGQRGVRLAQTRPGGEVGAANAEYTLRLSLAKQTFDLAWNRAELEEDAGKRRVEQLRLLADLELENYQAAVDREISLAELRKRDLEDYREAAGRVFDAIVAGRGGLKQFALGQLTTMGRVVFQNVAGMLFQGTHGKLQVPGAKDDNFLGRILQGTPFGPDLRVATDLNTRATALNTVALQNVATVIGGGLLGGGSNPALTTGLSSLAGVGQGTGGGLKGWGKLAGAGAAVAGGLLGTLSGINQGGLRGALTAGASIAGTAGVLLPMLSKSMAFMGPYGLIAGMGLGMLTSLLGDPKQKRDLQITEMLESSRYTAPEASAYSGDLFGRGVDYDYRGGVRVYIQKMATVEVKAMDARSFIDHQNDIADAVRAAMQHGHPVVDETRQALAA